MNIPRKEIPVSTRIIVVDSCGTRTAFLVDRIGSLTCADEFDEYVAGEIAEERHGVALVQPMSLHHRDVFMLDFEQISRCLADCE